MPHLERSTIAVVADPQAQFLPTPPCLLVRPVGVLHCTETRRTMISYGDACQELVDLIRTKFRSMEVDQHETATASFGVSLHLHKCSKSRLSVVDGDRKAVISKNDFRSTAESIMERHFPYGTNDLLIEKKGEGGENTAAPAEEALLVAKPPLVMEDCDWRSIQQTSHSFLASQRYKERLSSYLDSVTKSVDPVVYGSKEDLQTRVFGTYEQKRDSILESHRQIDSLLKEHKAAIKDFWDDIHATCADM